MTCKQSSRNKSKVFTFSTDDKYVNVAKTGDTMDTLYKKWQLGLGKNLRA